MTENEIVAELERQRAMWPTNAEEVRDFVGHNFGAMLGGPPASYDDRYSLTAHDLLAAFDEWSWRQPLLTDERIDNIAELVVKSMPEGIRGFCRLWGWRQFARELLDVCGVREGSQREAMRREAAQPEGQEPGPAGTRPKGSEGEIA